MHAYFVIGSSLFFSFAMIGLLAIDLAFTLKNRNEEKRQEQLKMNSLMDILWQVVYWGNFICGSFLIKFFQKYWVSGHFSRASRIRFALTKLAVLMVVGIVALTIFVVTGFVLMGEQFLPTAQAAILILNNTYGTVLLVGLLSYGIASIPTYLWKQSDTRSTLYSELQRADKVYRYYRDARLTFF